MINEHDHGARYRLVIGAYERGYAFGYKLIWKLMTEDFVARVQNKL